MTNDYDIIIIGSGVIGASIAYYLSKRPRQNILVIDKGFPLTGTSGATQAWVFAHNKTPGSYGKLSMLSAQLYPSLQAEIGDIEYKRTGGIVPFFDEDDWVKAEHLVKEQSKAGLDVQVLNRTQTLEKEPKLSAKIKGSTYSPIDGNVNPFLLVEKYVRAFQRNDVDVSFYNAVTAIDHSDEQVTVTTEKGIFSGEKIVFAGGPWTEHLGNMLDVQVPVNLVRGQILVTEPLQPIITHTLGGMRQMDNGVVLIGNSSEKHIGLDRRTTLDVIQHTAKMGIDFVPELKKAHILRSFAGTRLVPYDGLPILGTMPCMKNVYIAAMHSGVTLSPLVGKVMSELIFDGEASIDIDGYDIRRFNKIKP
ncbi:NAD(P)/FAD-dependent oxidoreductase [Natribacillus halophilus]|uniref:Sarcosine oxidase subunit beta n=1 Tax=Natribacillus halophilus TaxID=549003 RepID=A0A1G8P405_9BACI|nr:FAD-binding oxidoreductase [Natribacillus halophilus]SDI87006.1 sarcosine oxidase subunit beta [Natribacillus halophilus]